MASLRETIKKFDSASRILASSNKLLKNRLNEAIMEVASLEEKDFNPDLRKTFQQVVENIRTYHEHVERSDTQSATALSILNMCIMLHRETWE